MSFPNATLEATGDGWFQVHGELNFDTVTGLWQKSKQLFAQHAAVRVDLAGVTRSNSAGVALLIEWLRQTKARQQTLQFINLPTQMQAIIHIADLENLLSVPSDKHTA